MRSTALSGPSIQVCSLLRSSVQDQNVYLHLCQSFGHHTKHDRRLACGTAPCRRLKPFVLRLSQPFLRCSTKTSVLLHCAAALAARATAARTWLLGPADALHGALLLSPDAAPADDIFKHVHLYALDAPAQLVKLLAAVHLLPAEERPSALLIEDSTLRLLGAPSGTGSSAHERPLAFRAHPANLPHSCLSVCLQICSHSQTSHASACHSFAGCQLLTGVHGHGVHGAEMALLSNAVRSLQARSAAPVQLVLSLPPRATLPMFVLWRCVPSC